MNNIVCFLQNAWSPLYAGGTWPRESWLRALHRSRSGQRLKIFIENCNHNFWFDNTTPIVGDTPNSIVKPDFQHIKNVIEKQKPDVILTFGKQAEKCLTNLFTPLIILPHPACRVVTNALYMQAVELLNSKVENKIYRFHLEK